MTFGDPRWLLGLAALPVLLVLEWHAARRAARALRQLVGERKPHALLAQCRPGQRRMGASLRYAALALLIAGAARPDWGREVVRRSATGSDVVLVLDVSASMDARDVPPSRMEEARREAMAVVDRLEGSRVAVVAFAGDAGRLCPLTLDRGAVRLTLESVSSGSVSQPGTDLGAALRRALQVMPAGRRAEQAIVVWTDGEDLEQGAGAAMDELERSGVRVFAVGTGTSAGDVVPVLDDQGRAVDVKRDESGGPVHSRLNEPLLRALARRTKGGYFGANRPGGELPRLLAALGTVSRSGRGQRLVERPVARFPLCGLLAGLFLFADLVRTRRQVPRRNRAESMPLHSERAVAAALILGGLLLPMTARAQSAWARGDRAFKAGNWVEAESLYALRLQHGGPRELKVNQATASARAGRIAESEQELQHLSASNDAAGRAAGYNLGTVLGERRAYAQALGELRRALERAPDDRDARWNYEVTLRRKLETERKKNRPEEPEPAKGQTPQEGGDSPKAGSSSLPQAPQPAPNAPGKAQPAAGSGQGMDRAQAEQLLDALQSQARMDMERQHKVRVMREKHGKDW